MYTVKSNAKPLPCPQEALKKAELDCKDEKAGTKVRKEGLCLLLSCEEHDLMSRLSCCYAHNYIHTHSHAHTNTCTHVHAHIHTHIHTCTHTHARTHAQTYARAHTRTHTHRRTCTHFLIKFFIYYYNSYSYSSNYQTHLFIWFYPKLGTPPKR